MYIDKNGDYHYRGNLHTHTTRSDGCRSPEETKLAYRAAGYDFIALTDHWKFGEGTENDPSGLLVLSGCEYNFGGEDTAAGVFHIVGIGMETDPQNVISPASSPQKAIDEINARGGMAILAHPAWSLNSWEMLASLKGWSATEIYNSVSGGARNCRPYSGDAVDQLALHGYLPKLVADDDTHFWGGEQMLSYIDVNLGKLPFNRENLMAALRSGKYYATQGPRFTCRIEGNEFVVTLDESQNIAQVTFFTNRPWESVRNIIADKEPLREARYPICERSRFVRAEVYDTAGKTGWGQLFALNADM